jgi:hypothetical protein
MIRLGIFCLFSFDLRHRRLETREGIVRDCERWVSDAWCGDPRMPSAEDMSPPWQSQAARPFADTRLVETSRRAPRAVLCLTTAAYLCGLTDAAPSQFWLALPQGANTVKVGDGEHRWIRWSFAGAFTVGISEAEVDGVRVRWTEPSRTVVDLVRYSRHLRSLRPGVEAARRYVKAGGHPDDLLDVAAKVGVPSAAQGSIEMLTMALRVSLE